MHWVVFGGLVIAFLAIVLLMCWLGEIFMDGLPNRPTKFEHELRRIEGEVRRARRKVDRLEAEAMQAMQDEAIRHKLGNAR